MITLIEKYKEALAKIYEHVGFKEDWVIYPINDCTGYYWKVIDDTQVRYAESMEQFDSDGDYYEDDIYTQRFYSKHVYEGKDFTMIFCEPHVDGMKWFRLFDNSKQID